MSIRKHSKNFEIRYNDVNRFKEATPLTMLNYLEEAAISHSSFVGYDIDRLKSDGLGWVLNRWILHIDKYPVWNESVIVETWPSSFERFYATREFFIKNPDGVIIGRAASLWIFISIEKRRPTRIPENFSEVYGINEIKAVEDSFREIRLLGEPDFCREFAVRQSDIDTNGHVNNGNYVEWMLEALPQEVNLEYSLSSLEIEYKKETGYGDEIISKCKNIYNAGPSLEFVHTVQGSGSKGELAVGRTLWKKR